ncbi:CinA family protein [Polynucleobacter sp. Latsch14-2]|jgi:nicotinamide-nucleotide amidase|uniref:CinA family protein n=1 Tax=Polynucleobacter sp. Latsch14-2 TaxID=2576920 RepID=UPI001C0B81B7|nr:CinA family protein [Polynucleobacter sp. Latsch14-2]MBU3613779.1 CinA family protein [Polynucleobacter sp. Latsch14-2]
MKNNLSLSQIVAAALISKGWTLALAESCTGGLVCATLTDLAGSSDWFERGYITYSNEAKSECLGVSPELIESFGAVSEQVAKAMAEGAQKNAGVNAAISITGIAGPAGGSTEKPVGTVCFGWAIRDRNSQNLAICKTMHFAGDRQAVREQARDYALSELIALLK